MNKTHLKALLLVILIGLSTSLFYTSPVLVLRDIITNDKVLTLPLEPYKSFTMRWIHSVELEPWEESFLVDENLNIILSSTRFKAFGAGVPESAGERVETEDGYIIFSEIDQLMPNLSYGISQTAQHQLIIGDTSYPLYEMLPNDSGVKFQVESTPNFEKWFFFQ